MSARQALSRSGSSDNRRRARSGSALTCAGRKGLGNQFHQRLLGAMAKALSLDKQPILEGRVAQANAVQEIAAIERRRLLEGFRCAAAE